MNDSSNEKTPDDGRTRTEQKVKQNVDKTLDRLNEGPITYGTVFKYTLVVLAAVFIVLFILMTHNGEEDSDTGAQTETESAETVVERVISDLKNDESDAEK